jgi:hypothetical protein
MVHTYSTYPVKESQAMFALLNMAGASVNWLHAADILALNQEITL